MSKWGIPPRGDEKRAMETLIQNSQRLHSTTPEQLPEGATNEDLRKKINELLSWLSNKD